MAYFNPAITSAIYWHEAQRTPSAYARQRFIALAVREQAKVNTPLLPPPAAIMCECGLGTIARDGFCSECLGWDYGYCEACGQLAFKDACCEECGFGGFCPTCGLDLAIGTHEKRVDVDCFVCIVNGIRMG